MHQPNQFSISISILRLFLTVCLSSSTCVWLDSVIRIQVLGANFHILRSEACNLTRLQAFRLNYIFACIKYLTHTRFINILELFQLWNFFDKFSEENPFSVHHLPLFDWFCRIPWKHLDGCFFLLCLRPSALQLDAILLLPLANRYFHFHFALLLCGSGGNTANNQRIFIRLELYTNV